MPCESNGNPGKTADIHCGRDGGRQFEFLFRCFAARSQIPPEHMGQLWQSLFGKEPPLPIDGFVRPPGIGLHGLAPRRTLASGPPSPAARGHTWNFQHQPGDRNGQSPENQVYKSRAILKLGAVSSRTICLISRSIKWAFDTIVYSMQFS